MKRNVRSSTLARRARRSSEPQEVASREQTRRLGVLKTYKLYVGGKFLRTESGRYYKLESPTGQTLANVCLASRKDLRESVVAAREALPDWSGRSAYNRGQILYRIAEMLEGRAAQFAAELILQGAAPAEARDEFAAAVDRLVHYAGWADKFQQLYSCVNPVASSHFSFSVPEPVGVVGVIAPEEASLLGLVTSVAPVITGGNTAIVLASHRKPLCAVSFAEVLHTSDLPGGVVNILTGTRKELMEQFASHMDVGALVCNSVGKDEEQAIRGGAVANLKRVVRREALDLRSAAAQGPDLIMDTMEIKTTWHPVGF